MIKCQKFINREIYDKKLTSDTGVTAKSRCKGLI